MKKLFFLILMLFFVAGSVPAKAEVDNGCGDCVFETHTTGDYVDHQASALAQDGNTYTEAVGETRVDAEVTTHSSYYYYGYAWADGNAEAYASAYGDEEYSETSGNAYARGRGYAYGEASDYSQCGPQESVSTVIIDSEARVFSYAQKGDAESGAVAFSDTKATMREEYEHVVFDDNYAYSYVDSYNYYYYYNDGYASGNAYAQRSDSGYVYASTSGYSQVPYGYYYNNANLVSREHLATGTGTAAVWITNGGVRGEASATYSYSGNYYGNGNAWASGGPGCGGGVSVSAGASGYAYSHTQGYVQQPGNGGICQ